MYITGYTLATTACRSGIIPPAGMIDDILTGSGLVSGTGV
jgi:hypothetical protein